MAKKMRNANDFSSKANEILEMAQKAGIEKNFFFASTFQRYQVQLEILSELEKKFTDDGVMVIKEYVKGKPNIYTHPAVSDYNRTSTAANQTVATLLKIITTLSDHSIIDNNDSSDEL